MRTKASAGKTHWQTYSNVSSDTMSLPERISREKISADINMCTTPKCISRKRNVLVDKGHKLYWYTNR
jgi:hypothetical protein